MALFVQIDHFRKTDQKPTVKNHLFSISWFRSFNRTSFQQQLKRLVWDNWQRFCGFNRTSFQQQLKRASAKQFINREELQSYILSTTTETVLFCSKTKALAELQSYILSTTTETLQQIVEQMRRCRFNRTSFQQQLKPINKEEDRRVIQASIVHPFNNN